MTKEDKDLLFKDLCARLPYGVKAYIEHDTFYDEIEPYDGTVGTNTINDFLHNEKLEVRPYLRPMSSMTEEEKFELDRIVSIEHEDYLLVVEVPDIIDFYNQNHLDYRGLIPKGLALEAPEGMYKDIYVDLADGKDKTVETTYDGNGNIVKQEIK